MISMLIPTEKIEIVSPSENIENRTMVAENWRLGPEKTNENNEDYWLSNAKALQVTVEEAKRQLCANCEYFENTPEMLKEMENIPNDEFDEDGGGRGYCHKFSFICHNLRTCIAWDKKPYFKNHGHDECL